MVQRGARRNHPGLRTEVAVASVLLTSYSGMARCQITPQLANQIRAAMENRIEAFTILGGDFGFADGHFKSTARLQPRASTALDSSLTKIGGDGDIGDPVPLGSFNIGWQPRLQGNMGHLDSTGNLRSPLFQGDTSELSANAIEFGGGARFWLSHELSLAPSLMGLYGHTWNTYTARSAFMKANLTQAENLGLVNWRVDTWTLRPALNIQYLITAGRTIITLSADPTYFHTLGFNSSNPNVRVNGNSGSLAEKIDVDVPLAIELFGHELRSGGYLSRTELFGDLKTGLDVQHMNELHGRLVFDFLNQLWKVQWLGIGASYVWGPNITGWTAGADVAFRF
jgi:hypothetical protein